MIALFVVTDMARPQHVENFNSSVGNWALDVSHSKQVFSGDSSVPALAIQGHSELFTTCHVLSANDSIDDQT